MSSANMADIRRVSELQTILKDRGVLIANQRKAELVTLCKLACSPCTPFYHNYQKTDFDRTYSRLRSIRVPSLVM